MITGSHNPPDYNGFKMMIGTRPFFGKDIQSLGPIAAEGAYAEREGSVEDVDLPGTYTDRLLQDYRPGKPLTVVWACGTGHTSPVVPALGKRLHRRPTVHFPEAHGPHPQPTP